MHLRMLLIDVLVCQHLLVIHDGYKDYSRLRPHNVNPSLQYHQRAAQRHEVGRELIKGFVRIITCVGRLEQSAVVYACMYVAT